MPFPALDDTLHYVAKRIDAHIHFSGNHPDNIRYLRERDIKLINICYADGPVDWREQRRRYRDLSNNFADCYAWCTTFDPPQFLVPDSEYVDRIIAELKTDFDSGAVAAKIWKNIGMEAQKPTGEFVLVDHPLFEPVFDFIEKADKPILMHIGEPRACWQPLDERSPHYGYYKAHPQWHMYGKTRFPTHEQLIAARDRVLEQHPRIRFIGAHLGSLEYDVEEVARRLDRYPNFVVDTSARILDLILQDNEKVAAFLNLYQDRVLYGSDFMENEEQSTLDLKGRESVLEQLTDTYSGEVGYLIEAGPMNYGGRTHKGLALSSSVAQKILFENARNCYSV